MGPLVFRNLVFRALVFRVLVFRILVFRALVFRALVFRALVCSRDLRARWIFLLITRLLNAPNSQILWSAGFYRQYLRVNKKSPKALPLKREGT
jgi:hypothetical protein